MKRILLSASLMAVLGGAGGVFAQQVTGPFTAAQAQKGRADYMANCASCHLGNLSGGGEAPSLAAGNFMKTWGGKSSKDLYTYIHSAMPLGKGGSLSDATYAGIVAFLLEANGYPTPAARPMRRQQTFASGWSPMVWSRPISPVAPLARRRPRPCSPA